MTIRIGTLRIYGLKTRRVYARYLENRIQWGV